MGRLRLPLEAPPVRRRLLLLTGDRLRLGGLPALFSFLSPLSSPVLSIRCRLVGESDILVVELL